jgi:regulatory protein
MSAEVSASDVRRAAMDLLARREHAFQELMTKLARRFGDNSLIEEQVQLLADEKLQSDQRFAESFVRARINKCHGPIRIKNELRQRGVSERWVSHAMREQGSDWVELIQHLSDQKYGGLPPLNAKERAKRMRFFQYRGFSFEQINQVL